MNYSKCKLIGNIWIYRILKEVCLNNKDKMYPLKYILDFVQNI